MSAATQPKKWRAMTRAILVHGFTTSRRPPRPYFDLAPSVTSATSSSAAFVAAVAGSLTINIDQGRAQPEIVPESRPMTDSCGPNIAARGLTVSLILHAAAQSAFAREQATRSPSVKGQHHRRMLDQGGIAGADRPGSTSRPLRPVPRSKERGVTSRTTK